MTHTPPPRTGQTAQRADPTFIHLCGAIPVPARTSPRLRRGPALRDRRDRIDDADAATVQRAILNRLAYFDSGTSVPGTATHEAAAAFCAILRAVRRLVAAAKTSDGCDGGRI